MTEQSWDPASYARDAGFVADLGQPLVALLEGAPGERVLDLGCGDGQLTVELVRRGFAVVAVDASPEQVAAARARGLDARAMDGEALSFERAFEAVFSNAALHWMKRPEQVLRGVSRALVPGGRFVAEFGGEGNIAAVRRALADALARRGVDAAALSPWYFPSVAEYREELEHAGFRIESLTRFARPTPLPGDVLAWLAVFAQRFTGALPEAERPAFLSEVRAALLPTLCDAEGRWTLDYVRIRVLAHKNARA